MFKQVITSTALCTEAANQYFEGSISGDAWQRDYSFLSTLRALLGNRIGEGKINLRFGVSTYNDSALNGITTQRAMSVLLNEHGKVENELYIHNLNNMSDQSNGAWAKMITEHFEEVYEGWKRVDKVTMWFRRVFNVICFINPELKSTIVFAEKMDIRKMHYLQCTIPSYIPWYFGEKIDVTKDEIALLESLREKTPDHYTELIAEFAKSYDFQTGRIRKLLRGFETRYERDECDRVQSNLVSIDNTIQNLEEQIADYLRRRRDNEIKLLGLQARIAQSTDGGDSELMEYFLCNKSLLLQNVSGSTITFIVRSTLEYFDSDAAESYINNKHSYFYTYYEDPRMGDLTAEERKLLMTEIFVNQTLKLHVCAAYELTLDGSAYGLSGYDYGYDCDDCYPNPHIDHYHCLGGYESPIVKRLKARDYIGAIEQCVASCKSLNLGDYPVMGKFTDAMIGHSSGRNTRCIELPTGEIVTPRQAVDYLMKEKETVDNG